MRIGIDARMLGQSGIGRYIECLIRHVTGLDANDDFFLFVREAVKFVSPKVTIIKADIPWYSMQEQMRLLSIFQKAKLDLLHVPHFNVPLFYRDKFVVTIHDLTHTKVSMERATTLSPWLYRAKRLAYQRVISHAVYNSAKIITVSKAIRDEILGAYKVPPSKIVVTHEAVEDDFCRVGRSIPISEPYFFYVGNAHPHKNLERLLSAFAKLRADFPRIRLILAGREHFFWQRLKEEARRDNLMGGVSFIGGIDDVQLEAYYQHAQAYVFPSLSEGFGLPVLEALKCGTCVVASRIPALTEVGGKAVFYFDPTDVDELVLRMKECLVKRTTRKWKKEVAEHLKKFSWLTLATDTLRIYQEALRS